MSIIEKAASRIDQKKERSRPLPPRRRRRHAVIAATAARIAAPVSRRQRCSAGAGASVRRRCSAAVPAPAVAAPAGRRRPCAPSPRRAARRSRRASKAPSKVELDLNRMRDMGMVTAAGGRTLLVEDFRIIKRPLIKRAFAERGARRRRRAT